MRQIFNFDKTFFQDLFEFSRQDWNNSTKNEKKKRIQNYLNLRAKIKYFIQKKNITIFAPKLRKNHLKNNKRLNFCAKNLDFFKVLRQVEEKISNTKTV